MIEKLGGRKFIYALIVVVMVFVGWILGKLDAQQFINFATSIGGIYVAGNVLTDLVNKNKTTTTTEQ